MSKGGSDTTTVQREVPPEFKPAFLELFSGGRQAAQAAAGASRGFGQTGGLGGKGGRQGGGLPGGPRAGGTPLQLPAPAAPAAPGANPLGSLLAQPLGLGQELSPSQRFNQRTAPQAPQAAAPQGPTPADQVGASLVGSPFPGPFIAGPNPFELGAIQQQAQLAGQFGGLGQNVQNLGNFTAQGGFLTPQSNPFLQATIQNAIQPQIEAFQQQILPTFQSQALQAGAFRGSSARDLAQNQLTNALTSNIARSVGDIAFQNFANERGLQQNAGQLLDQAARLQQLSPTLLGQAGAGTRGLQQQGLDERLLQFQEGQQAPFRPLFPLASLIHGGNIGQNQTINAPRPSPIATGIQGALGGGALGLGASSLLGQQSGLLGPAGLGGLGAGFGLLGGLFG